MDEAVQRVAARARAAGNARPKAEVTTRRVAPSTLQPKADDGFRRRGLKQRLCARPSCNMEYTPTSPSQKYHSPECRRAHEEEKKAIRAARVTGSPPRTPAPAPPPPPRKEESPPPSPPPADPPASGSAEEIGWGTVDRFLELLFTIAGDGDEEPSVRITALEMLDWFATLPLRGPLNG